MNTQSGDEKITPLEALAGLDHYFSYEWLNNDAQYIFQFYVDSKYSGKDQFFDKDVYFYDYYEYNGMPEDRYYCIEYSAEAQKNQSEIIEQSVGMPADLIQKAGNLFFMKYTGITDGAALEEYYKKLGLLYAFNVSLMPGGGSARSMEMGGVIMDNLLRPIVLPNVQTICGLFKVM